MMVGTRGLPDCDGHIGFGQWDYPRYRRLQRSLLEADCTSSKSLMISQTEFSTLTTRISPFQIWN